MMIIDKGDSTIKTVHLPCFIHTDILFIRLFCVFFWFHRPKHYIHYNDNQYHNCHSHPKTDIKTKPFGSSEKGHPKFFPVHHCTSLKQFAEMTDIGFFQTCCQSHVQQNTWNQISKVCCRQCNKSKHSSKHSKRNNGQNRNSCHC